MPVMSPLLPLGYCSPFSNTELAERLYRKRYPQRDAPDCQMFTNFHHNLREYGSLQSIRHSEGGSRVTQTPKYKMYGYHSKESNSCYQRRISR
ncbi:hypothetical protein TNCV_4448081 [Trichonephila clavipes]|nr:hypothetical protein TNCV_4448081 [Trichonephila clavipes]